jgi:GH24 family phage-related lysozyme (muramidase)
MAFDSLQVPATIINNDKLVSMAGNLMAKEKADEERKQKLLTDEVAKLDATKLRPADVKEWNEVYKGITDLGIQAMKNPDDIDLQVKFKAAMNGGRGFITDSLAAKEEYDKKFIDVKLDKDYDPQDQQRAATLYNTPTSKLRTMQIDGFGKLDKKDYLRQSLIGFDGQVKQEFGNITEENTPRLYPEIRNKAINYINGDILTDEGRKAFTQFTKNAGLELRGKDSVETEKLIKNALDSYADTMTASFMGRKGSSVTMDETKDGNQSGFDNIQLGRMYKRLEMINNLLSGDKNAIDEFKLLLPKGSDVKIDPYLGANKSGGFVVNIPTDKGIVNTSIEFGRGGMSSLRELNRLIELNNTGYSKITTDDLELVAPQFGYKEPSIKTLKNYDYTRVNGGSPNPNTVSPKVGTKQSKPAVQPEAEFDTVSLGNNLLKGIKLPETGGKKKISNESKVVSQTKPITIEEINKNQDNLRVDGSKKGNGFLGALKRPDGKVSTEISVGVNINGKETEIPTLVPTLTKEEVNYLLTNDIKNPKSLFDTPIGKSILNKSKEFAKERIGRGVSPFYQEGEEKTPTTPPINKTSVSKNDDIYTRIKLHENVKDKVYPDSEENPTIGVGFNLTRLDADKRLKSVGADPKLIRSGKARLTANQIETLYVQDLNSAKKSAKKLLSKTWDELPKDVQEVLTEMAFNLGEGGLSEFKNTLGYIEDKRFKLAAQSMLKTKWARQVGSRAKRLAKIIENA